MLRQLLLPVSFCSVAAFLSESGSTRLRIISNVLAETR